MPQSTATLSDDGTQIYVSCPPKYKDVVKAIPGRRWNPYNKQWELPRSDEAVSRLRLIPNCSIDAQLAAPDVMAAEDTITEGVEPLRPMPIKVKPYAHQIEAYNIGISKPAAAILHEQGCGKSLTAVAIAGRRYLDKQITKLLVVAPLAVLPVWAREFEKYSTIPHRVTVLEGSKQKRIKAMQDAGSAVGLNVLVINYESVWRLEIELSEWQPDMIIADESQRIKTPSTSQSKAMQRMGKLAKYRLLLTGTPVNNSPLDLWGQYRYLAPEIFPNSYYAFRGRYAVMGGYGGHQVISYQHLDELADKAHSIAHRVTKAQALDLPEQVTQYMYSELEPKAAKVYKQLKDEAIAEIGGQEQVTAPFVVTKLMRLSQIAGGFITPDDGEPTPISKAKLKATREAVEDLLDAGKKVVIFARFRPEIEALCSMAADLVGADGYRAIWGDVPGNKRGEAVQAFQQDEDVKIFIGQIQCAGSGITLTAADTAIFYSLDYSYVNHEQARARIHRIGQRNTCTYIYMVARGTVDNAIVKALEQKKNIADLVVDNWKSILED